ncbi:MAG: hypothetical protein D6773_12420 [Alphaproteobacteria bacterium]|nr:MAG: hypothetical protein D6773_12420 [Alphaproteobacteria bacterium]
MTAEKRTRSEWIELIERQRQSGQTARAFCEAHGIDVELFYRRRRSLRLSSRGAFAAVRVRDGAPISIEVAGVTIRCTSSTPPAWIASLAAHLAR